DGRTLATASRSGTIRLWEVATGRQVLQLNLGGHDSIPSVTFSPDGQWLAARDSTAQPCTRVWRVATGKEVQQFPAGAGPIAFSPDSKTLALSAAGIEFREVATGKLVGRIKQTVAIGALAYSPDGKTIASGGGRRGPVPGDTTIYLWDAATGKLLDRFSG